MRETRIRSLAKGLSWRISGTVVTVLIAYFFTSSVKISAGIGLAELSSKIAIYYFHERLWGRINWGKRSV